MNKSSYIECDCGAQISVTHNDIEYHKQQLAQFVRHHTKPGHSIEFNVGAKTILEEDRFCTLDDIFMDKGWIR